MIRIVLSAWFCLAGGEAQMTTAAPSPHAGVVRSAGQPVPGAVVTATQADQKLVTTTDEMGRYEFPQLPPGRWTIEVRMTGFVPARKTVEAAAGATWLEWKLEVQSRQARNSPQPGRRPEFERLALIRTAGSLEDHIDETVEAAAAPAGFSPEAGANEAFLLSGSLSANLQAALQQGFEQFRAGFEPMRDRMMGQEAAARAFGVNQGETGAELGGAEGRTGPAGPPSLGGAPAGPGMLDRGAPVGGPPVGGGPGMPGGRPGPGGGIGPGMRGGPGLRPQGPGPWRGDGPFGNRIARGQVGVRGSLFFTLNNSALDARPFSLTGQKVDKPSYAQSRFGLVVGGPLLIPKLVNSPRTFFFFNYSAARARSPYHAVSTLPTPAERQGDFSQSAAPVLVFDPLSRAPWPGNRVPASRMDSIALGLLPLFPLPNQPGFVQNYQYVTSNGNHSNHLGLRVNRSLSQKDRLDVNSNLQWRHGTSSQLYGFRDSSSGRGGNLAAGWTHNFTPRSIYTLRWNFSRNRNQVLPYFAYGRDIAGELGIHGVSRDPVNYGPPNLNFTNFGGLSDASASLRRDQTSAVTQSWLFIRGRHNFTLGGEYRRMQLNSRTDQNGRGTFSFTGLATSAFNPQGQPLPGTGFDFADFLLGLPQSSSIRFGASNNYFRSSVFSAFLMEDWRLRSNFTLNLGLRYEYFQPFYEKYDHMANLDVSPHFDAVAVVTPGQTGPFSGRFGRGLVDPDNNNLAPRVGLAWRPSARRPLLVRASYGIFYNGSIYNQFPFRLASQPPFARTASLNTSEARPLTLRNGFAAAPSQTVTNTYAVDRGYRVGYAQTWSFSIQRSLPHALVVEAAYLGTKGTRLDIQRMPNRASAGSPLTAEQRRRIGNAVGFIWDSSEGNSIYHGGQVRLTRRFSRGVSANLLYVYSKSLDNASTLGGGAAVVAQNDTDLRAERGRSSFDQRHSLSLFYVLHSPVRDTGRLLAGRGRAARLLKDWSLSGGLTAGSGPPLTARLLGNQADAAGTGAIGSGRADATGLPLHSDVGFFNLAAFAVPRPGTFGNAGRNTIDGPTQLSLNLSLARSFRLDERRALEFRADSQNFTNHVSYTNLGTVVNASDYGLPTATAPMRRITAQLRFRF